MPIPRCPPVSASRSLPLYSYNTVYRLREPHRLHLGRLNEFAAYACEGTTKYSFSSWVGRNDNLRPARPQDISPKYTCSTMVTAAYHYAGLTLDLVENPHRVIFPRSIANGTGHWNLFALPLVGHSRRTSNHSGGPERRMAASGSYSPRTPASTA